MSKKRYYVDNLVEVWQRDWFEADSDEDAIELAETGEYAPLDQQYLEDWKEYIKTDDHYVFELYDEHDNLIKRNEKK